MYVQIVKFKLKAGSSRESFLALTEQMIGWLEKSTGFVAYELYEGEGCWSDRIVWDEKLAAQNGLKDFLATETAAQIFDLADSSSKCNSVC